MASKPRGGSQGLGAEGEPRGSRVTHSVGARLQPSRDGVSLEAEQREEGSHREQEEGRGGGRKEKQGALFPWVVVPAVCPTSAVSYPSFFIPLKNTANSRFS